MARIKKSDISSKRAGKVSPFLKNVLSLLCVFVLMCLVALSRDHQLFGKKVEERSDMETQAEAKAELEAPTAAEASTEAPRQEAESQEFAEEIAEESPAVAEEEPGAAPERTPIVQPEEKAAENRSAKAAEGKSAKGAEEPFTISTEGVDVGLEGFRGPVPVEVVFEEGKITSVTPLENEETPRFFQLLTESDFFSRWNGLSAEEAAEVPIDAVTGATYSSQAAIENVRYAAREAQSRIAEAQTRIAEVQQEPEPIAETPKPAKAKKAEVKRPAEAPSKPAETLSKPAEAEDDTLGKQPRAERKPAEGERIVSTKDKNVGTDGYMGPVPVEIVLKEGRIKSVEALPNDETEDYFNRVVTSGLLESWNGLTPAEALGVEVDAVTGATYSSKAVIANVRYALSELAQEQSKQLATAENAHRKHSPKGLWEKVLAVIVVIAGCFGPQLIRKKKKIYRKVQLLLNVAVLGFLTGSFLSYSLIVRALSHGIEWPAGIAALLMLIAAFIMPLFGGKNHYCLWICPLGSAQELLGGLSKKRIKLSQKTVKYLTLMRKVLWLTLMILMWCGVLFSWMDYEPFGCFRFWQASVAVICIGVAILVLSLLIPRPFCRFVCPTGSLFKASEGNI